MTSSRYPQITDELLSAYIDQAVTAEEKTLVEAAIAAEPSIAWRLETLRQTVLLLRSLPVVALPRSFALPELQLASVEQPVAAANRTNRALETSIATAQPAFRLGAIWEAWQSFWRAGSPVFRNAAAVSFALFLVLIVGNFFVTDTQPPPATMSTSAGAPSVAQAPAPVATAVAMAEPTFTPTPAMKVAGGQAEENQELATESTEAALTQSTSASTDSVNATEEGARGAAPAADMRAAQPATASAALAYGEDNGVQFVEEPTAADEQPLVAAASAPQPEVAAAGEAAAPASISSTIEREEMSDDEALVTNTLPALSLASVVDVTTTDLITGSDVLTASVVQPISAAEVAQAAAPATATPQPAATKAVTEVATLVVDAGNKPSPNPAANVASPVAERSILQWSQIATALLTLILAALWWWSRTRTPKAA